MLYEVIYSRLDERPCSLLKCTLREYRTKSKVRETSYILVRAAGVRVRDYLARAECTHEC